jgi:hypothetical protein
MALRSREIRKENAHNIFDTSVDFISMWPESLVG